MLKQEKMVDYINRTKLENVERYTIYTDELDVLYEMMKSGRCYEALILVFMYGRAKGYRMAKNEVKNGKNN